MGWRAEIAKSVQVRRQVFSHDAALVLPETELGLNPVCPCDDMEAAYDAHRLRKALLTLRPREAAVLRLRFGLEDGREHTLREIGERFRVGRARIGQIEKSAIRKLKHPSRLGHRSPDLPKLKLAPTVLRKPAPRWVTKTRQVEYINFQKTRLEKTLDPLPHWRVGTIRNTMYADLEGEQIIIEPFGYSTDPIACADFDNTEAIVLFYHNGLRYGEDWRKVKMAVYRSVPSPAFETRMKTYREAA